MAVVLAYIVLWIIFGSIRSSIWYTSVSASETLSQKGGFLRVYSWIFSNIFYQWYVTTIGLLLLLAPRKHSALKAVFIFLTSYFARQYIRLGVADSRPQYTSTSIALWDGCDCSYGMPSGHSEGSSMIYSLLFYEIVFQTPGVGKKTKIVIVLVWFYVILSILFARVFYGRHSLAQVSIGAFQGLVFFWFMLYFEKPLDKFFLKVLNGIQPQVSLLFLVSSVGALINIISWYGYFDSAIADYQLEHVTCQQCFDNNNLLIRRDLGNALQLSNSGCTIVAGYWLGKSKYTSQDLNHVKYYWSLKGLFKGLFMLAMFSPMLIVFLLKIDPAPSVAVSALIQLLCGFLISYGYCFVNQRFKLTFPGDISISVACDKGDSSSEGNNPA